MNLTNKAFKTALKNFWEGTIKGAPKRIGQALGESSADVALKKSLTITDPEKVGQIAGSSQQISKALGTGEYSPRERWIAERSTRALTETEIRRGEAAFEDFDMRYLDPAITRLFNDKFPSPDERRQELSWLKDTIKSSFNDPQFPVDTTEVVKLLDENRYNEVREAVKNLYIEKSLKKRDAEITGILDQVFVDPEVVKNIINKNKEARFKSIFDPSKDGATKFETAKNQYIKQKTKKMPEQEQKSFIESVNKEYAVPENLETATADELKKYVDFYNRIVPDKEKIHYNTRDIITDKAVIFSKAQEELGEFGTPLAAKELTKNGALKLMEAGGGLTTNMAKAYSWFKGVEDATANSIGRAIEYMGQLPKFGTRNNELLTSAGIALNAWKRNGMTEEKQLALQNSIRSYMENLTKEGSLTMIDYNGRNLTANVDLMQRLGLQADDVEFANKIINAFRLSKKHMDYVNKGLYEQARDLNHIFADIDGLNLEDVSMLNRNHPTFGFVQDYFPIVPNQSYKEYLMKLQASQDPTAIGHIARQQLDLIKSRKDDLSFFLHMRRLDRDSTLKDTPSYRLKPSEEILTHAKAVDRFYKSKGYEYFDQIEFSHSLYNVLNNYGREEADARNLVIKKMRDQYDFDMNPKPMGEGIISKLLSGIVSVEIATALSSPRMSFFNMLQGLELGGSIAGYRNHAKAIIKNTFGAAGWALHEKISGRKGLASHAQFIEECYKGKFDKGLLYGDDAIIANNVVNYFKDEPITSLVNMADAKYLLTQGVDERLRLRNTVVGKTLGNLIDFANYGFMLSEKVARASTIDASTKHFLDSARKTIAHIQAHPEMTNPQAVKFFAKELHLDALNDSWKTQKILNNLLGSDNLTAALKDNGVLQRMSQDYAYTCVNHQIFEYDAIHQSLFKAKMKHTSPLLGIPLTFKSWGMHFTEYFAGLAAAAYNGDPKPLIKFATQSLGLVVAASYVGSLGEDKKYKKGEPQELTSYMKEATKNAAKYYRGRVALFTPLSMLGQPLDKVAGIATPVVGAGLWLPAATINLASKALPGDDVLFPYLESAAWEAMMGSVIKRKTFDLIDNINELKGMVK